MPVANNGHTILLAEDDLEVRSYLETALRCQGYSIEVAEDGEEALSRLRSARVPVSAVVLDVIMPRKDGIEALREIRRFDRHLPVIVMSGAASELAIADAMKSGANEFLAKPVRPGDLRKALKAAVESAPASGGNMEAAAAPANGQILYGSSPQMRELQTTLADIGLSDAPVLIQGETGTGKEMLARDLHARSRRAKKILLKLNCAALPSELVESELFGYERGAFTGAFEKKPGMFSLADGGTILLDEIGDMDFKLQAKLLQVLQDKEFPRLGGKDTIKVDVRVIAATHCDLERAIAAGRFREDLYYRLNVIDIRVPPLRERREDILPLADFLIRKHSGSGTPGMQIPLELQELFLRYDWPGNIRELENIIRKFLVFRGGRQIEQALRQKLQRAYTNGTVAAGIPAPEDGKLITSPVLASANGKTVGGPSAVGSSVLEQVARAKREAERAAILAALKTTNWNRKQAALTLQVDYKALLYKMNKLSIHKEKKEKPTPQPIQARAEAPSTLAPPAIASPLFARRAAG